MNSQNNEFNNNYKINNNQVNSGNKKIFLIIVITLVLLAGIFGITKLFGSASSSVNDDTVKIGEELKIKKSNIDFSIEVLSPVEKKHIVKDGVFANDEYDAYAVKINVKNNGDEEISLAYDFVFKLLDSEGNKVERLNMFDAFDFDGAIKTTIPSGDSATGYLYFYEYGSYENKTEVDINKVDKLEIGFLSEVNTNDDAMSGIYKSYFVKLK